MSPTICLEEIRILVRAWWELSADNKPFLVTPLGEHLEALCERVEALDEWLVTGGKLPSDWRNHDKST